jgi:hypothetical protein
MYALSRGGVGRKQSSRASLPAAHERYVNQLREQSKLRAAGGIGAPDDLLGLVIFRAMSMEEGQRLLDDAIQAAVLRVEYHHWWSSDRVLPW